ncbi:MAG TPA: MBL fold metallo-hydrolase [Halobacteria archaeon]|jgi:phosphoribosyl 1,2-cyclic phosphodiesterase|nr:MBL fold metallo-hydrolase [Halobacteria archaeon]
MTKDYIKFLGTGGSRFVVAKQLRSSGGVFIKYNGLNIILDPGPGTLVRCNKSKPPIDVTKLDAILLSHLHIDHSNDVNILIDGMTVGGFKRRGVLFAPEDSLKGDCCVVLNYLRSFLTRIEILKERSKYTIGSLESEKLCFSTSIRHNHPVETYGLIFDMHGLKVSFMVDTKYFPGLIDCYKGSDILVINVTRRTPSSGIMHLSIEDVKEILKGIKPKKAILTHFGMTMLKAQPAIVAKDLTDELGIEVIAARDGMSINIDDV